MDLGRTFHSRLKAPLSPDPESTLQIRAQSHLAKLVRMSKLVLIDEATMLDCQLLEAMDRTFRDLMQVEDKPFGGKSVILAGDFRQCLPVVQGATRAGTVRHCINQSFLWSTFTLMSLTVNMRVRASGDPALEEFIRWTMSIGDGDSESIAVPDHMETTLITKNRPGNTLAEENSMKEFCESVFPDIKDNFENLAWLEGRAIMAPTNKEVETLNNMVCSWLPGDMERFRSADSLDRSDDLINYSIEYLNSLNPSGIPGHILALKHGMPLMLMRNINPKQGLCNGTKLIYDRALDNKLLVCTVAESGKSVLIPRINFPPKVGEYPFGWQRRQFPVRPAFAMTVNKSQGKILTN